MALTLSTAVKNVVANMLFSSGTYAAIGAGYQQTLIDDMGAASLTHLEMLAQHFTFTSGSGAAPDEWLPLFYADIVWRASDNAKPEQVESRQKTRNALMREALATYSPAALNVSPSTSEAFVYNVLNNRKYVINACSRMSPPLYLNPHSIDSALDEILTLVWNKGKWTFARRPVVMRVTRTTFTGGIWTDGTKTISSLTGISASIPAGTRVYITSGAGVLTQDFVVVSSTTTTLVLTGSLKSDSTLPDPADVAGFYYVVTFEGVQSGETFDSFASGKFYYTDTTGMNVELCWRGSDDFARWRNGAVGATGRPQVFRAHQVGPTTTAILLSPPPDADYSLRGEVIVRQAADPASTTATTAFDVFAVEFMPTIRRAQLDRVLTNHGRENAALHRSVVDEIESLFPEYQSVGDPPARLETPDRYGDFDDLMRGGMIGGGM